MRERNKTVMYKPSRLYVSKYFNKFLSNKFLSLYMKGIYTIFNKMLDKTINDF